MYSFAASNGTARTIGDLSKALVGVNVNSGQTTHCSATRTVYIGVSRGGAGKDVVLSFSLTSGTVVATTPLLGAPLPRALWAACDASLGFIGGVASSQSGSLEFGVFSTSGGYTRNDRVTIPSGWAPSGLLTATSDRGATGNLFLATINDETGAAAAAWTVDPWGTGKTQDALTDFQWTMLAASWDRSNW